ncbi:MFS transporter [Phytomonospora sp. NPDC050363]|uniref:MFS transporter n=1 Tax=Phytomonospora sp. NPDC050363 TaxID=3155642 RepID=UPI003406AD26
MLSVVIQTYRDVLAQRHTRATFVCLIISGAAISGYVYALPVHLDATTTSGPRGIGLYFAAASLTAIPVTLVLGRYSDRVRSRGRLAAAGACWVAIGMIALNLVEGYVAVVVVGVVFISLIDFTNGQLLAVGRELVSLPDHQASGVLTSLRSGYSLGYTIGPVLLGGIVLLLDTGAAFAIFGGVYAAAIGIAMLRTPAGRGPAREASHPETASRPRVTRVRLYVTGAGLALLLTAPILKTAYLGVFVIDELDMSFTSVAAIFGVTPIMELVFLPLCGTAAVRWGPRRVVLSGGAVCVVSLLGVAVSTRLWHLIIFQIADAFVLAAAVGVAVSLVQDMSPGAIGFGTSVFQTARISGHLIGSTAGGIIGSALNLRWSFAIASLWVLAGTLIVAGATRKPTAAAPKPENAAARRSYRPVEPKPKEDQRR